MTTLKTVIFISSVYFLFSCHQQDPAFNYFDCSDRQKDVEYLKDNGFYCNKIGGRSTCFQEYGDSLWVMYRLGDNGTRVLGKFVTLKKYPGDYLTFLTGMGYSQIDTANFKTLPNCIGVKAIYKNSCTYTMEVDTLRKKIFFENRF
jgi:hypothetical protein